MASTLPDTGKITRLLHKGKIDSLEKELARYSEAALAEWAATLPQDLLDDLLGALPPDSPLVEILDPNDEIHAEDDTGFHIYDGGAGVDTLYLDLDSNAPFTMNFISLRSGNISGSELDGSRIIDVENLVISTVATNVFVLDGSDSDNHLELHTHGFGSPSGVIDGLLAYEIYGNGGNDEILLDLSDQAINAVAALYGGPGDDRITVVGGDAGGIPHLFLIFDHGQFSESSGDDTYVVGDGIAVSLDYTGTNIGNDTVIGFDPGAHSIFFRVDPSAFQLREEGGFTIVELVDGLGAVLGSVTVDAIGLTVQTGPNGVFVG